MLEKFIKLDKFLANLMKLKENSSLKVQQIYFFDLFALSEKKGNYMKEVKIFNRFFSDLDKSKEFFINTVKAPIFLSNLVCLMKEIHDKFSNNKHIANENEINDIEKLKSKYIKTTLKQIEEKLINFTQFDQSKDYKRLMRKMEKHFKESIEKNKSKINKVDKVEFVNSILEMSERKISKIIFSRFKKEITQNFYQFTEEIKTMIGEKKTSVIFPRYDLNINKSSWKHSIINNFIYMSFFANIVLLNCRLPTNSSVQIYLKITNNLLGFWNLYDLKNGLFLSAINLSEPFPKSKAPGIMAPPASVTLTQNKGWSLGGCPIGFCITVAYQKLMVLLLAINVFDINSAPYPLTLFPILTAPTELGAMV